MFSVAFGAVKLTDAFVYMVVSWLAIYLADWMAHCLAGWLAGWPANWMANWLARCMYALAARMHVYGNVCMGSLSVTTNNTITFLSPFPIHIGSKAFC